MLDSAGPLAVAGAGTAASWAGALGPADAVLDLRALTGVITHNPGDMTVSVRAGTPLRDLNAELADHGQHVAFDAARVADGATVGGLLATGDAGPGALVHGSLRDLVIGTTLVLADGTVARSGGHVIKNVAGYDLAKLVHGSYGTLAVVAEVVLRLHPLPHAVATLVLPCTARRGRRSTPPGSSAARTSPPRWSGCRTRARCWCGSRAPRRRSGAGGAAAELLGPAAVVADAARLCCVRALRQTSRADRRNPPEENADRPRSRTGRHGPGRQRRVRRVAAQSADSPPARHRRRRGGAARLLP